MHGQLGRQALPSACRQFPRVVTLTPRGVSVTLSHYCPTAVDLLIPGSSDGRGRGGSTGRDDPRSAVRIVVDPPAFPASWPFEGPDARTALPPLLRPGVLMTWAAHGRWDDSGWEWELVADAVPTDHARPQRPPVPDPRAARLVEAGWRALATPTPTRSRSSSAGARARAC